MRLRPLPLLLAATLACPAAQAANFTWHGDLMDGDAPAEGAYDLRVRSFANPDASKALGEATELPSVALSGGRFNLELDLPEDADGTTWVQVAVRKSGTNDTFETLGDPQPIAKVNSTCPGAWALDGNSGAPAGSFLGHADDRAVFVDAPRGVAVNSTIEPVTAIDLSLHAKSGGDADADLGWVSRNSKKAGIYLRDGDGKFVQYAQSGGFEFSDGVSTAIQNNGLETFSFSGRLRSRAAGSGATDTSGGIWFDDERSYASFVGRGDNASNFTGIYEPNGGWRFTAHDNGAFGFNTGTTSLDAETFSVNASGGVFINRPAMWVNSSEESVESLIIGPKPDSSGNVLKVLQTRADGVMATGYFGVARGTTASDPMVLRIGVGGSGIPASLQTINLADRVGILRDVVSNALEVNGTASKSTAGDWLANSDRRIKTGIAPVPNALDTIMQLRPVTFRYDAAYRAEHKGLDDKRYYNVIAQEFANVFPDAVKGSGEYLPGRAKSPENEILQVDTYPAQITAIAAIQELAVQDDALRDEIAVLERDNAGLRAQLDALTQRLVRLEHRQER